MERKCNGCSFLLGILVTICLALSIATTVMYFNREVTQTTVPICVTCDTLKPWSSADTDIGMHDYDSLKTTDDGKCCAESSSQMSSMVSLLSKKFSRKTSFAPSALEQRLVRPEANHVFAQKSLCLYSKVCTNKRTPSNPNIPETENMCILNINSDRDNNPYEITKGVNLTRNGLLIVYPGLYFVYKSIHFLPNSNEPCRDFKGRTFKSLVIRHYKNSNDVILNTEHTCCPDCVHDSETGFNGGVFQLKRADLIQVNVTGVELINFDWGTTYIGVMMLSNEQ